MNFSKTTFFTEHLWATASPIGNQISILETKQVFEVAYFSLAVNCCHRQQFPLCFIIHILSLKESTCEIRKNIFLLRQKSFWFSKILQILQIQISWRHQMLKHKIRNTFYWITWEASSVCQWNLDSLCPIIKQKKTIRKFCKSCSVKTSSELFCVCKELCTTSIGKWKIHM